MRELAGIIVHNPVLEASSNVALLAPRPQSLRGVRIGFLWNHRQGGERILERVEAELTAKYSPAAILNRTKLYFGEPASKDIIDELGQHCDVVITALGD